MRRELDEVALTGEQALKKASEAWVVLDDEQVQGGERPCGLVRDRYTRQF